MRRTSALKKRIDHLLDDITSLRNIVLTLTRGYNIPQDPMVVQMIEQTLCHGRWSYLPELSRVLEQHTATMRQAVQPPQEPEGQAPLSVPLSSFQPQHPRSMAYGGGGTYSPVEQTTTQAYSAAVAPPSWSPIDMRTTPAVYTDVGQPNPSYLGSCAYRPLPQYPVSSNSY
jgi:hypothetical protein